MTARASGSKQAARGAKATVSRAPLRSHKELEAYQRSMELLVHVHELCDRFPVDERRDLAGQMRRASEAIPISIAESFASKVSQKDFKRFMKTAMASASEMEAHLKLAGKLGFVVGEDLAKLSDGYSHIGPQLNRLMTSWKA